MPGGFKNKPKILRGAFVEYGLSIPPLFVVFQFNPVELSRNRSLNFNIPRAAPSPPPSGSAEGGGGNAILQAIQRSMASGQTSLREFHHRDFKDADGNNIDDLIAIRDQQQVTVQEESISFEIRLDATDKLNEGDIITEQFGIAPQLSTLELMVHPKSESLLGAALDSLLGSPGGFSFTGAAKPPMILFIWGRKKVLPVNINSLNITETEFSTDLNPIRATASVSLTVIEGKNIPYTYSKAMKEVMSVLNLANITDIADVVIPG
ncbi:MAG: hypothetical protein OEV42_07890 [Deltaproteobacteria bacterium]|nr:hypothetical protein [Deltaproteobacteria bacterium]